MDSGHWVQLTLSDGKEVYVNLARVVAIEHHEGGSIVRFSRQEGNRLIVVEKPLEILKEPKL